MAIPGPYSGVSTLAFVTRASVFAYGVVYGSLKLSYLKIIAVLCWSLASIVDPNLYYECQTSLHQNMSIVSSAKAKSH